MDTFHKTIAFLVLLIIPFLSFADIYKCNVDGKTIFSDTPCSEDAEIVDIQTSDKATQSISYATKKGIPEMPEQPKLDLKKTRGGARAVASPTNE